MEKTKFFFCLFIFLFIFSEKSNLSAATTPQQQVLYLEKFSDLLNVIDDDKKREMFVNDLKSSEVLNFFSFEKLKALTFYSIKISIIFLTYFLIKFLGMRILNYQMRVISEKRLKKAKRDLNDSENYLLLETVASLFKSIFIWTLRIIFFLLFLIVSGVSVGPFIYGVSFIGFGVTLASQNIIKDFINGILIITDGSLAVGEVVHIAGHLGLVENITLRSVSLRNKFGYFITIPFSNITDVLNYSRHDVRLRTKVIITAHQPIAPVEKAFEKAAKRFKEKFKNAIKEDFSFLGVTETHEYGVHVEGTIATKSDPSFVMRRAFATLVHEAMCEDAISRVDAKQYKED